ncbi:ABC transporter ATP-binding protein [Ktedonosporobacter rubrisoli]|uniref:ABC transporter ATP-binding protein n=1 Tax=Ktedonosporobacter rubrisoli TaxID=2509675 RepID=A0A4P6JTG3_KTERU|nr:ABC transporter ATP-binding protein [Ktedonosporobacter rubrisoli]QBD78858.1 ABC transporter ATP-binding protein [Ktedonosporobacter rubrisoli]
MSTIFIDQVSKQYKKGKQALQDVTLRMEAGVWGLVGPNGAGKTTLLRILASLLKPTSGVVSWDGEDIVAYPQALRCELGYLPQHFGVYPQLTAYEFLRYIGELKGLTGSLLRHRVDTVLDLVHLTNEANHRLRTFSGGMIRRIGIAQALINDPRILVLDEPTVGLDPAERVSFREIIASLQGERLVILSTHIITDIEVMATEIALLRDGRLFWNGTCDALLADATNTAWSVTLDPAAFERLRATYQTSQAIRHGKLVEVRLVAHTCPHPEAVRVEPTLEEAYLSLLSLEGQEATFSTPS